MKIFIILACVLAACAGDVVYKPRSMRPKIVNGTATTIEHHPYAVQLLYYNYFYCGGTILDENTILTAAHCCDGVEPKEMTICLGTTNLTEGCTIHEVEAIFIHEGYDYYELSNDTCIAKTMEPIAINNVTIAAMPVCDREPQHGENVTTVGWGTTSEDGYLSHELMEVALTIVGNGYCSECYSEYGPNAIDSSMLCAAEDGKDACQGDSGGALTAKDTKGQRCQAGITSWGEGCARKGKPGVYCSTFASKEFIEKHRG